jgi:hypothetical protein
MTANQPADRGAAAGCSRDLGARRLGDRETQATRRRGCTSCGEPNTAAIEFHRPTTVSSSRARSFVPVDACRRIAQNRASHTGRARGRDSRALAGPGVRGARAVSRGGYGVAEWTARRTAPDGRRLEWDGIDVINCRDGQITRNAVYSPGTRLTSLDRQGPTARTFAAVCRWILYRRCPTGSRRNARDDGGLTVHARRRSPRSQAL